MMTIPTQQPDLLITQLGDGDAEEHFAVIDRNRAHLAPWLPWVPLVTQSRDIARFIAVSQAAWQGRHELACALRLHHRIIGGIGIVSSDHDNESVCLGYWLDRKFCGQGYMSHAVMALTRWCFGEMRLHRVEIHAAARNLGSRRVAERLGFTQEGVRREAGLVAGVRHDMVIYARLTSD